ncbi:MAG: porin family protein, partial [Muribaculaceae bacterium]|nr:porin family protein [Muribaculaceae bacterium]
MLKFIRHILLSSLALCAPVSALAQEESYRYDMGAGLGMGGYLGDLNETNPFARPGFTADATFSYRPDVRWAFRTTLGYSALSGNSADLGTALPDNLEYKFHSSVVDLTERVEFNFFNYGIGETYKHLRRWSPYITVGLGAAVATCEGQSHFAFVIPMGVGVKYKLRQRLNLALEFTMTKAFSDRLDGTKLALSQVRSS